MEASGHALSQREAWSWVANVPVSPRVCNRPIHITEIVQKLAFKTPRQIIGAEHRGIDLRQKRFQPLIILMQRCRLRKQAHILHRQFTRMDGQRRRNWNLFNGRNAHTSSRGMNREKKH